MLNLKKRDASYYTSRINDFAKESSAQRKASREALVTTCARERRELDSKTSKLTQMIESTFIVSCHTFQL